ncbi:mitotic spindle assembly checkpoint protein MAD2A-like [Orcinus orca]|uniref:mitotic spindle assembly checkpoint protein MAD2A-like n=1 Tax=Orcinus orca TaxID=9733 RepID=UPI0002BCDDB5|nr:mitotic spindle assembly checkpoint protein MAD2A-like [Orcinus orca]
MWDAGQPCFAEQEDQGPELQAGGPAFTASPADPSEGLRARAPHPGDPGAPSHPLLESLVFPICQMGIRRTSMLVKLVDGDGLEFRKRHSGPAFGINSILYQRGLYPSETFTRVQKYGLTLLVTTDPELIKCLNNVVQQLKEWLYKCSVQKLVVVISNIESGEVLERWQFDIECDKTTKDDSAPREMSQKAIQDEIRSVIRQITATVTFLPLLEVSCSFDLLIYTDKDLVVPEKWEESGPQFITSSEEVHLRSFTTTIHKVSSMVAYKIPVND